MIIQRIIISSNNHPGYVNYWPLVAHSWRKFTPTLFFIGDKKEFKFKPIEGTEVYFLKSIPQISSCHYARIIRILVPILFPNDVCLTTDIDILPLNIQYFINKTKDVNDNNFVLFTSDAYPNQRWRKSLCYLCGKGSTYASIIKINYNKSYNELIQIFNNKIRYWYKLSYYRATDEYIISILLSTWCVKRQVHVSRNINSSLKKIENRMPTRLFLNRGQKINITELNNNQYIDVCLPKVFYNSYFKLKPILQYLNYNINRVSITRYGKIHKIYPIGKQPFYKNITAKMLIDVNNIKKRFGTNNEKKKKKLLIKMLQV